MSELWKMKLRTEIKIHKQEREISHQDSILLMGSCFSDHIGNKLKENKFDAVVNPLGIAYNPISLHQHLSLDYFQLNRNFEDIQLTDELYYHYDFHSKFNSFTKEDFKVKVEQAYQSQLEQLNKKPIVFLTYGTAWVHELKSNQQITNNCHKQPSALFNKRILSTREIVNSFDAMKIKLESEYGQSFNFIFTISPVRHLKDGFIENQLSKSTLNLAIHQICSKNEGCSYFPSFEIMIDDLRDYRFYNEDLLHPNDTAIKYIWKQFSNAYFSEKTNKYVQQIEKFNQSLHHRPFNIDSEANQKFLKKLKNDIEQFSSESNIDLKEEVEQLENQILPF